MAKLRLLWVLLTALCPAVHAADPILLTPLAYSSAPPCPTRIGLRAARSNLVQFGGVSASLSSQSAKDSGGCTQSTALWVTRQGVSHEFDLRKGASNIFEIVDIAPDSSSILLSTPAAPANPAEHLPAATAQVAIVSLNDNAVKWLDVQDLLGLRNCEAAFAPQGYMDNTRVVIAVIPGRFAPWHASCPHAASFYSVGVISHSISSVGDNIRIGRFGQIVSGPVRSCRTDPDVSGCHTARARLAVSENGAFLQLWQKGSMRLWDVEDGMLPAALSSSVTPTMRMYATMVICSVAAPAGARPHVCIDSAINFKPDPLPPKAPMTDASQRTHSSSTAR